VPKHIGIVAVSPEGAALCYRDILRHASHILGDTGHPRVSLHNEPFELYIAALMRDDWHTIGDLLRTSAQKLAAIGAQICITPDNVMQHGVHLAEHGSPIPWITMTNLVADAVANDGRKVVGLIGTKMVMFGSTYQTMLGLKGVKVLAPNAEDAENIDSIIFGELVHGQCRDASRTLIVDAIKRLADRGAEAVILGSSEAPIAINADCPSPLPAYDPVSLLAEGTVKLAIA